MSLCSAQHRRDQRDDDDDDDDDDDGHSVQGPEAEHRIHAGAIAQRVPPLCERPISGRTMSGRTWVYQARQSVQKHAMRTVPRHAEGTAQRYQDKRRPYHEAVSTELHTDKKHRV
eukprot:3605257-Rhodomonas_salina.1